MIVRNRSSIVLVISLSLLIESGEAGWKFWKKDKETTTTTTTVATPTSVNVQPGVTPTPDAARSPTTVRGSTAGSAVNTAAIGAANPGLAVGGTGTITAEKGRNNVRPGQPNPGTEVGLDIAVPRPNRPGIGGGNGQNYRDWAVDLTGAGEPSRNQPSGPTSNSGGQARPTSPPIGSRPHPEATTRPATSHTPIADSRSTSVPGIRPTQRPSAAAGSRSGDTPHQQPPSPQSTGTATRPTSVQPVQPHVTPTSPTAAPPAAAGQSRPSTPSSPSSGKSWADVAAGGSRPASPTGLPRQPEYPRQPTPDDNARGTVTGGGPTQPRPATGAGSAPAVTDSTGRVYSSNPTYSKGNTITDEDLEKLSEALYIKETNNNANRHVTLNLQKKTTSSSPTDEAPQSLLTVSPEALQIPTIQRVLSIFDNYQLDTHTNEYISPAQRQEESLLVDTFLSTNVMSAAMRFLANKGFVRQDYYEYKDMLRRIWFNLFSRGQGKVGSTGFEHVFMAETRQGESGGTEVLGLHNWIYFNAEETKRRVDYLGYIKKIDLGTKGSIVKVHARFNGHDKPVTAMFVGTSPELEMALYTVCFYARPDGKCPVSLGGTKFDIVTYKFKYRGKDLIGTAYPDI